MRTLLKILFFLSLSLYSLNGATVEIDVHGMTCAFCVDSLQTKLQKLPHVNKVDVSLKLKKVRLQTDNAHPDVAGMKKAIEDTGFTPLKAVVKDNEN